MTSHTESTYVLITGATRGLGLEFVHRYAQLPNTVVLATARNPDKAVGLKEETREFPNVHILTLDMEDENSIYALPKQVEQYTQQLHLLINNAGAIEKLENSEASKVRLSTMQKIFTTNSFSPILVTQVLLPFLKNAKAASPTAIIRVVMMSSNVASIHDNESSNLVSYFASKTALNQLTKSFSNEEKDIVFLLLHPGWVQTDMGSSVGKPPLKIADSINGCIKVIQQSTLKNTGTYVDYQNNPMAW